MYRTIIYLHDFEIKQLRLEQDYIDFKMREFYSPLQYDDFIEDEIRSAGADTHTNLSRMYCWVCARPYILGFIDVNDSINCYLNWLENVYTDKGRGYWGLLKWNFSEFSDFNSSLAEEVERSFGNACKRTVLSLQNRGLKAHLKHNHSKYSFQVINQLLNDKIKEHE